jgi:hypothetical protein
MEYKMAHPLATTETAASFPGLAGYLASWAASWRLAAIGGSLEVALMAGTHDDVQKQRLKGE